ncbi:MAG: AAA family ATPase [Armatimonadetes bacterium]|nr:AAA family ATPase [Armatimonadota bacterium]
MQKDLQSSLSSVILIGPVGVGKTTIARLIGEKIATPVVSLDDVCYDYYREIGWNGMKAKQIYEQEGSEAFTQYDDSFRPYAVEQVLARNPHSVIDLGVLTPCWKTLMPFPAFKLLLHPTAMSFCFCPLLIWKPLCAC